MSLRLKLLLVLFGALGLVWFAHTGWQLHRFEKAFVESEVRGMRELGAGLRVHIKHLAVHHAIGALLQTELECCERDVMVIDRDFRVVAASDPNRVGRTWIEPGIEMVMRGDAIFAKNDHEHDGTRVIDVSIAVPGDDDRTEFVIHAARRLDTLKAELAHVRRDHLLMLVVAFLLMSVLVTVFTQRMILTPLGRMHHRILGSPWGAGLDGAVVRDLHGLDRTIRAMLTRIEDDQAALRELVKEKDELYRHVHGLKQQLEVEVERVRKELQAAEKSLLRAERHAVLAQLSAALAHELRNPLHIVRGLAETAGRKQPDVREFTKDIKAEVDRIELLIRELLQFTRPLDLTRRRIELDDFLGSICDRVARARLNRGRGPCQVKVETGSGVLFGDPVLLDQALENLIENACDALGPTGRIVLRSSLEGQTHTITVRDDGPGIPEEDLTRVLEPFFTRKSTGTGLGLCVAQRIVELHNGDLELANHPEGGLIVTMRLPQGNGEADEQDPRRG